MTALEAIEVRGPAPAGEPAPLHVCDITTNYHQRGGGIRTYLHEKRKYLLAETTCRHTLVVPAERSFVERNGRATTIGIASPVIPGCAPYRFLVDAGAVHEALAGTRPDVVEVGCSYAVPWIAFAHRRMLGGAVVAFYHTDFPTAYAAVAARRVLGEAGARVAEQLAAGYARALYRRCDATLTASAALREKLVAWGVPNVALTPLGVDTAMFHPDRRSHMLRRELGVKPGDTLLLFAGRLDSEKRVELLVDAFRRLPAAARLKLVLVGNGPLAGRLRELESSEPRLRVLPFEPDRERLATLLASADLFVSAAPHETFGLSVVEAQASGLPVVGVRAGAMIERVDGPVGLLAEPNDAGSLARAVAETLAGDRAAMGAAARRLTVERSSWSHTFERLLEVYQFALHERRHEAAHR